MATDPPLHPPPSAAPPLLGIRRKLLLLTLVAALAPVVPLLVLDEPRAAVVAVGVGLATILLALVIADGIVTPLNRVTETARRVRSGDGTARSAVRSSDEVGVLAETLDGTLESLAQRDAELRETETRYRQVFWVIPDAAILWNRRTRRVMDVNAAALGLYGWSRAEFVGQPLEEIVDEEVRGAFRDEMLGAVVRPTFRRRWAHRTRDGRALSVELSATDLWQDGEPVRLFLLSDRTALVSVEGQRDAALRQLEALQRLEAEGRVATAMFHDLGNATTSVLAYCDLAIDGLDARHPSRSQLDIARLEAQKAAFLARAFHYITRPPEAVEGPTDLVACLRTVSGALRSVLGERTQLEVELPAGPAWAAVERTAFELAMVNLALWVKGELDGGERVVLALSPGPRLLGSEEPEDELVVTYTVTRRMRALSAPARPLRLVEGRHAVDEPDGELRLSVAAGVLKHAGGAVGVERDAEGRATVAVRLRRWTGALPEAPVPVLARADGAPRARVLLVEDDATLRRALQIALTVGGLEVEVAESAEEGMQKLTTLPRMDLVLTDVVLPRLSGLEFAARVHAGSPGTKVLFMSGYADEPRVGALRGVGGAFIAKPFGTDELLERIRAELERTGS